MFDIDRGYCYVLSSSSYCLWILGNERTLSRSDAVWKDLIHDAKKRRCFFIGKDECMIAKVVSDPLYWIIKYKERMSSWNGEGRNKINWTNLRKVMAKLDTSDVYFEDHTGITKNVLEKLNRERLVTR